MLVVLVNKVPDNLVDVIFCPAKPVFYSRFNIKDGPTIQLSRVHFAHLVLRAMLATVDSSHDQSLRVKVPAIDLTAVGQLKQTLTDFLSRTVNLIQEQKNRLLTSSLEPLRWVPRSYLTIGAWQSKQITLGHLRSTPFNNGKSDGRSKLIDNLRLAYAMASTNQNWFANRSDMGDNGNKGFKVNSH